MPPFPDFAVRQLQRSDVPLMGAMMTVFGDAFKETDTYKMVRLCPEARCGGKNSGLPTFLTSNGC